MKEIIVEKKEKRLDKYLTTKIDESRSTINKMLKLQRF